MAKTVTDRAVNASQLGVELGRAPVHVRRRPTVIEAPTIDDETLAIAVGMHVANDAWADPKGVAPEPTDAEGADVAALVLCETR